MYKQSMEGEFEYAADWAVERWGVDLKQRLRKLLEESAEAMAEYKNPEKLANELGDVQLVLLSCFAANGTNPRIALTDAVIRAQVKHGIRPPSE